MGHAAQILKHYLKKSHGEGSRGGHILGHTRSGHPIYATFKADSAEYLGMTPSDHASAAMMHDLEANKTDELRVSTHHSAMAASHRVYHQKAVERFNALPGQKRKQFGYKLGYMLPPEDPKPEDGSEVGKTFTGRMVYSHRKPHLYDQMLAAEHGDASQVHATAANKAKDSLDDDTRKHHEAMRFAHVQAAISAAKIEAQLRGLDERHYAAGRRSGGWRINA